MSPDTFMSWRCPNGGLELEGRSWVSHLFLSPAQGLRQPWIHIRYQLTVTELLNGNLLGLSALLNSTQLALPHGILSTSRYFMRVVTPSWLDRQSETKGLCLKPNTFTLLNFYNWDILLWMKLDKMTPSLRFVGLGKYSCWFCFVWRRWNERSRPAGRKSDCGPCLRGWHRPKERSKTRQPEQVSHFAKLCRAFQVFLEKGRKERGKGRKRTG